MRNIYIFSGLGADERIFQKIDFSGFNPVFIKWTEPFKDESLREYAIRLSSFIPENRPLLIGLSYGGMIATEIAKYLNAEKLVLISSAVEETEIPGMFRFSGRVGIIRLLPYRLMLIPSRMTFWIFTASNSAERSLLASILEDTDVVFFRRALRQISLWDNKKPFDRTARIHGDGDKILPLRNIKTPRTICHGGHFICYSESEKITHFIRKEFARFLV